MDKFIKFMSKLLLAILCILAFVIIGSIVFFIIFIIYKAVAMLKYGRPL